MKQCFSKWCLLKNTRIFIPYEINEFLFFILVLFYFLIIFYLEFEIQFENKLFTVEKSKMHQKVFNDLNSRDSIGEYFKFSKFLLLLTLVKLELCFFTLWVKCWNWDYSLARCVIMCSMKSVLYVVVFKMCTDIVRD